MKEYKSEDIAFPDQVIIEKNMAKEVKTSFIEYAMSVITSRALPDVRDGMKPGQRRILYAMYEDRLTYDKPFRKSATTVGNVLGRYHPHGDSAVYQTMVRMAQAFSLRYPLVEGHGNFGNVDGDGAAAYRYTEARMSKIADSLMSDMEKNVVPMTRNFDNTRDEPVVLPSRFPNLLVNGSVGIAVGMATNIPPHNLSEVIDGTIYRMQNKEATVSELMQFIKGPDFPTYATIYGSRGMYDAYATGRGKVIVRAKGEVEAEKHRIIFTEIPYQVNKSMLIENIANLVKEKRIENITDVRDESGRAGMRIVIEYRRDANGEVILNQLYKYTQLQDTCAVNMLALVGGEPKVLTLPQILDHYIAFQQEVIIKRTENDLAKAKKEMHIYEGYQIALDHIDEIIKLIRSSASIPDAKAKLIETFGLSDLQAQAIVEMALGKLSGLERQKIEERLAKLHALVAELEGILADPKKIDEIVITELSEIKRKFGDERRTELVEATDEIELEDLIPRHTCVVTLTNDGYIKRQKADTYSAQRRGGKGVIGMKTKEEDDVEKVIVASSHDFLMMFTNMGKVHTRKGYRIPEASRTAKGTNLVNILDLAEGEKITTIIPVSAFAENAYLLMVTKHGIMKRTRLSEYEIQRKGGKIALTLDEGDELLYVRYTEGETELILATRFGKAVRFHEDEIRVVGRLARGVKGITLQNGDFVVGATLVKDGATLLTITERGYGKRTPFSDFRTMKNRGGMGVVCHNLSEKTGHLSGIGTASEEEDVMMMTADGTIVRTPVKGISLYSRTASGVIVMRLSEGTTLSTFTLVAKEEESDTLTEEPEETDENSQNTEKTESTESAESTENVTATTTEESAVDAENTESTDENA